MRLSPDQSGVEALRTPEVRRSLPLLRQMLLYLDPFAFFKDAMNSPYYDGYKGPISTATGAVGADYVLIQMCASVATGAATPEAAAAEAEQRCKRYFRRQNR